MASASKTRHDPEESYSAGLVGLADAIRKFREGTGATFRTYAARRIKGAILDAERDLHLRRRFPGHENESFPVAKNFETDAVFEDHMKKTPNVFHLREEIAFVLRRLQDRERLVLVLHYLADWTFKEIADVLGVSESFVYFIERDAFRYLRLRREHG